MARQFGFAISAIGLLGFASIASADIIKTSTEKHDGRIERITPTEVEIVVTRDSRTIPVAEIESIEFKPGPVGLKAASTAAAAGRYTDAEKDLARVAEDQLNRPELQQEHAYLKTLCAAKLALTGKGKLADAEAQAKEFISQNAQSYHLFTAWNLLGELRIAQGKYDEAAECFQAVGRGAWPEYKLQAAVSLGETFVYAKQFDNAEKILKKAKLMSLQSQPADAYNQAADVALARCALEQGRAKEALATLDAVLAKAPEDEPSLLAKIYVAKGLALRKLNNPREAVFAFLRVHTMYASEREQHAEALFHLAQLWQEMKRPDRQAEANQILSAKYHDGPWDASSKPKAP